ncbi:MAG: nucleotidyltransferase [Actinobacteria bacterium HGW-Actinobacteria-2]|nr:MAG: nucleotidyltransferase [Actinobacteria bacterium HGW-Actinobacteria-2]
MDVELREIRDFLASHPPYSALPDDELDELPARMHLRYFRRGTTIVELNKPNSSLFILRSGAVDIYRDGRDLVERADPGNTFGTSSVLSHMPSRYRIVAIEDSLVLVLPGDVFSQLVRTHPEFADYFNTGTSGTMKRAVAQLENDTSGRIILKTRVGDIVRREPITAPPTITIRQAARVMTEHRVSALLITEGDHICGIVTDRDLRSKVVAAEVSREQPITTIMTADPMTIGSNALAVEAMLEMLSINIHHLPVVDDDKLLGLVSSGDLMRLETANPVFLVGDIAKQSSSEGLATVTARLPQLVAQLVEQDASADEIHRLVTAVSDATTHRLLQLAEAELGAPPVPYEWLVLGSQGRYEHGLGSDQDHVLLLDDAATAEHDGYFAGLAEYVTAGMESCGYPRCVGQVMAVNPRWRQTLKSWEADFHRWMLEPAAEAVLHAQIFFDFRSVHGGTARADQLRETVRSLAPRSPRFLGHLAAEAVERQPPIGFFRGFVVERGGGPQAGLDLKSSVHCIVELVRVLSLANGIPAVNTVERLHAVAAAGAMSAETESAILDAFELITYLRLRHQARQVAAGESPTNAVSPDALSALEKKHLRDVFGIIRRAQQALAYRYQTHLMS